MPSVSIAERLKTGFSALAIDEVLQLPASNLMGVSQDAADALKNIGVQTIFDLGSSWLFANALAAIEAAPQERGAAGTPLLEGSPPATVGDAASLPLESLRGISDADAAALKQALALQTIRDFALWPPRRVAQGLMSVGGGVAGMFEGVTGVLGFGGGMAKSTDESETNSSASDDEVKAKMIAKTFLPKELVDGQGGVYPVGDLYQP